MTSDTITFSGGPIFDGRVLHENISARFENGRLAHFGPLASQDRQHVDLEGDILSTGYTDLQVNGGGGVMLNDNPSIETIRRIAQAHRSLGSVAILPTLITDTPEKTQAAIEATIAAVGQSTPGIVGLHLEGPHLSVARKGAHDAALIRPMRDADLDLLLYARRELPALMVTVAPENVSKQQVTVLDKAGVVVSLGHTDAGFDTCVDYANAGARCATHLFNAMSQLGNREPGLVGAVLSQGRMSAGLIADGIHSHAAAMHSAWFGKARPGHIFLVSDSMAVAGTDLEEFSLEGRLIRRHEGRLTLADGTLAGADLDLTTAVRTLTQQVHVPLDAALGAATTIPSELIDLKSLLSVGQTKLAQMIRIASDLSFARPLV